MYSESILQILFCKVVSLQQILDNYNLRCNDDCPQLASILKKVFVCVEHSGRLWPSKKMSFDVSFDLEDVIHHAIEHLLTRKKTNILTLGYKHLREYGNNIRLQGTIGICSSSFNSIVAYLKTEPWEMLHKTIGTDLLFHLLTDTYVFVTVPNRCYIQLTGLPVSKFTQKNYNCKQTCSLQKSFLRPDKVSWKKINSRVQVKSNEDGKEKIMLGDCRTKRNNELEELKNLKENCNHLNAVNTNEIERRKSSVLSSSKRRNEFPQVVSPKKVKLSDKKFQEPLSFHSRLHFKEKFSQYTNWKSRWIGVTFPNYNRNNSTLIKRSKIFYSPVKREIIGKKHILNRVSNSNSGVYTVLNNIFKFDKVNLTFKRIPKYFMPLKPLIKSFIVKFQKFPFLSLLKHYCPLPKWFKIGKSRKKENEKFREVTLRENIRYKIAVKSFVAPYQVRLGV